jgi:hypothetical protein
LQNNDAERATPSNTLAGDPGFLAAGRSREAGLKKVRAGAYSGNSDSIAGGLLKGSGWLIAAKDLVEEAGEGGLLFRFGCVGGWTCGRILVLGGGRAEG